MIYEREKNRLDARDTFRSYFARFVGLLFHLLNWFFWFLPIGIPGNEQTMQQTPPTSIFFTGRLTLNHILCFAVDFHASTALDDDDDEQPKNNLLWFASLCTGHQMINYLLCDSTYIVSSERLVLLISSFKLLNLGFMLQNRDITTV